MTSHGSLLLTEEQEDFRRTVRRLMADLSPESTVREQITDREGFDQNTWRRLAELGMLGIAVPEQFGGAGYGPVEAGLFAAEAGRVLLVSPYFSSVILAANTLAAVGADKVCASTLAGICGGRTTATLAVLDRTGAWGPGHTNVTAARLNHGWNLSGSASFVPDVMTADVLLVPGRMDDGLGLFLVDSHADGVLRSSMETVDMTRKLGHLCLDGTVGQLLSNRPEAESLLEHVLDLALVQIAAEQAAGTRRVLELAVEHAKVRHQFGRPIGSFQAVKHLCADMLIQAEQADAAAAAAAATAAVGGQDLSVVASIAAVCCSEAFLTVAENAIEVFGGIGFTWEHPAHLYYRRALADHALLGTPTWHRERIAALRGFA